MEKSKWKMTTQKKDPETPPRRSRESFPFFKIFFPDFHFDIRILHFDEKSHHGMPLQQALIRLKTLHIVKVVDGLLFRL
jgi:hypothetical protein